MFIALTARTAPEDNHANEIISLRGGLARPASGGVLRSNSRKAAPLWAAEAIGTSGPIPTARMPAERRACRTRSRAKGSFSTTTTLSFD